MRVKMTLSGLFCSVTVLVAGCSATIPGIPVGPGGGGPSGTGIATHAPVVAGNSSVGEGDTGDGGTGENGVPNHPVRVLALCW